MYHSEIASISDGHNFAQYIADKAPLFYRDPRKVAADLLEGGYFLSTVRATLAKIPTSASFQQSHFAEIASAVFAEEVLGLVRLYSKLSMLTAENANAYKMDLLLCDPSPEPVEFIFAEVKSSVKSQTPAKHDAGCFADLFTSMKKYESGDLDFDLTAARDRLDELTPDLKPRVMRALLPYSGARVRFAAFVVIDSRTRNESETRVLGSRKSVKDFDVDLMCVESLSDVASQSYKILEQIRDACSK